MLKGKEFCAFVAILKVQGLKRSKGIHFSAVVVVVEKIEENLRKNNIIRQNWMCAY